MNLTKWHPQITNKRENKTEIITNRNIELDIRNFTLNLEENGPSGHQFKNCNNSITTNLFWLPLGVMGSVMDVSIMKIQNELKIIL